MEHCIAGIPRANSIFEAAVPKNKMMYVKMPRVPHLIMEERSVSQVEDILGRYACALLNNHDDDHGNTGFSYKDLTQEEILEASFLCTPDNEQKIYKALKELTLDIRPKILHEAVFVRLESVPDAPELLDPEAATDFYVRNYYCCNADDYLRSRNFHQPEYVPEVPEVPVGNLNCCNADEDLLSTFLNLPDADSNATRLETVPDAHELVPEALRYVNCCNGDGDISSTNLDHLDAQSKAIRVETVPDAQEHVPEAPDVSEEEVSCCYADEDLITTNIYTSDTVLNATCLETIPEAQEHVPEAPSVPVGNVNFCNGDGNFPTTNLNHLGAESKAISLETVRDAQEHVPEASEFRERHFNYSNEDEDLWSTDLDHPDADVTAISQEIVPGSEECLLEKADFPMGTLNCCNEDEDCHTTNIYTSYVDSNETCLETVPDAQEHVPRAPDLSVENGYCCNADEGRHISTTDPSDADSSANANDNLGREEPTDPDLDLLLWNQKHPRICPTCGGYILPPKAETDKADDGKDEAADAAKDETAYTETMETPVEVVTASRPVPKPMCLMTETGPRGPCVCVLPRVTRCGCAKKRRVAGPQRRKFLVVGVLRDTASSAEDEPLYQFKNSVYVVDPETNLPVALNEEAIRDLSIERPALRHTQFSYISGKRIPESATSAHINMCICGGGDTTEREGEMQCTDSRNRMGDKIILEAVEQEMAIHLVSFLNSAEGGMFDIGVKKDKVAGFHCDTETEIKLRKCLDQIADNDIEPKVLPDSYEVRFVPVFPEQFSCNPQCGENAGCCCCDSPRWHPDPPPLRPCPAPKMMLEVRVKPSGNQLFSYRCQKLYRWNSQTHCIDTISSLEYHPNVNVKNLFTTDHLATVGSWAYSNKRTQMKRLARQLECKVYELLFYLEQPLRERWYRVLPKALDYPIDLPICV